MLQTHSPLLLAITAVSGVTTILALLFVCTFGWREVNSTLLPTNRFPQAMALLGFLAFAILGSWVPFQFKSLSWRDLILALQDVRELRFSELHGSDWVANILLFVPIGFFAAGATAVQYRTWKNVVGFSAVIVACAAFSISLEISQLWFPPRVPSARDILAQTIGASAGGLLWLVCGVQFAVWTRAFAESRQQKEQLDWILECYAIGLLLLSIFPLDLTFSLTQIVEKYRAGRIELIPAWSVEHFTVRGVYQLFKDVVFFVPIGMLSATWRTLPQQPVRHFGIATCWGVAFVALIELVQLLIVSRYTSLTDIVLGAIGVGIGVWIMHRWKGVHRQIEAPPSCQRGGVWLGLAVAYAGVLLLAACLSKEPWITDTAEIKRRYLTLYEVPMNALYWGDPFHALGQVTQKLLFFAPLGVMCCQAAYAISQQPIVRWWILASLLGATFAVAVGMEVIQIFLPDRYPSLTDAVLRTFGAAIAMLVTAKFMQQEVTARANAAN